MILFSVVLSCLLSLAHSQEENPCWLEFNCTEWEEQVGPMVVDIGAHINRFAALDIDAQTIKIDIYVWYSWDLCKTIQGEIPSPVSGSTISNLIDRWGTSTLDDTTTCNATDLRAYSLVRYETTVHQTMNFARYPLDIQEVLVTFEAEEYEAAEMEFRLDPVGGFTISEEMQHVLPGWTVNSLVTRHSVKSYKTNWGQPNMPEVTYYSTLSLGATLSRPVSVFPLKILLPVLIVEIVSFLGFFNEIGMSYDTRMGTASGCLLAAIFLQLSFGDKLPRGIEYLTLMDWMFNISYLYILYVIIETIIVQNYDRKVKQLKEENSNRVLKSQNIQEDDDVYGQDNEALINEYQFKMRRLDKWSFIGVSVTCPLLILIVSLVYKN
eukprot:TRINITY_DN1333_c0_g1_i1.p1 TRINITY_DN1333_c0_g1~~TRINITY_DN1333_c0_g1_i1.p1  ORF type:complete len:380 (-),score=51.27 TRINITY_DN1333_c0_g1_i1:9-1148(-)